MRSDELQDLLEKLRAAALLQTPEQRAAFDEIVEKLRGTQSGDVLEALLQMFRDDDDVEDQMQRLVHVVKSVEGTTYGRLLASATGRLHEVAPFWTGVLVMRLAQSPADLAQYSSALQELPLTGRRAAREVLDAVIERRPDLGEIFAPIRDELR